MAPQIERLTENLELGEGPHWDEETNSLYFVDILGKLLCRYVPSTKKLIKVAVGGKVSLIIPVKNQKNTFLITWDTELRVITWDGETDNITVVKSVKTDSAVTFNDGKCDPTGRLWAGTVGLKDDGTAEPIGALYVFEKDTYKPVQDKITISNGLAFNPKLKKFYYIDSQTGKVDEFNFDINNGTIANRQPIFTLSRHNIPGIPDGMTIDSDGNLWVAIFNGGRIIKIDPRKQETLLQTVSLPAKQVTSVAFGGKSLDELYVTTGNVVFGPVTEKLSVPENGALYRITGLGVKGLTGDRYVI